MRYFPAARLGIFHCYAQALASLDAPPELIERALANAKARDNPSITLSNGDMTFVVTPEPDGRIGLWKFLESAGEDTFEKAAEFVAALRECCPHWHWSVLGGIEKSAMH